MLVQLASNMTITTAASFADIVSMVGANAVHVQIVFVNVTGSPGTTGTCTCQISNDKETWIDLATGGTLTFNPAPTIGKAYEKNFTGIGAAYVRFKLLMDAGLGVVAIIANTNSQ